MDIDPDYKTLIHTDASALLRPKTGLKDMFLEVSPGSHSAPVVKDGFTIPVQNTLPDVNPDEIYGALDADTRQYLRCSSTAPGRGSRVAAETSRRSSAASSPPTGTSRA